MSAHSSRGTAYWDAIADLVREAESRLSAMLPTMSAEDRAREAY